MCRQWARLMSKAQHKAISFTATANWSQVAGGDPCRIAVYLPTPVGLGMLWSFNLSDPVNNQFVIASNGLGLLLKLHDYGNLLTLPLWQHYFAGSAVTQTAFLISALPQDLERYYNGTLE